MIYPCSVLIPIRYLCGVTSSTDTINRGNTMEREYNYESAGTNKKLFKGITVNDCAFITNCKSECMNNE